MRMRNIINFLLILISLFFISCSEEDDNKIDNTISSFHISTGEIYPKFDPEVQDYYITSLNTLNYIDITIDNFDKHKIIYINNNRVIDKTTSIKLNIGEDIIIKSFDDNNVLKTYTVHYLPADMPKTNVITKSNPANGYILINLFELSSTPSPYNYLVILDNDGFPVYYKRTLNQVINFKYFETVDHKKRFSYNDNTLGKVMVMNEKFETINELQLLPYYNHSYIRTDNHDFLYFDDNHYILPSYVYRSGVDMTAYGGSSSVELVDFVFQEILNNQVVFEWNSADYPEFLQFTDPIYYNQYATNSRVDYFHFNSINIDPNDNNFIVSARHLNQIIKINRTNGQIIWRFGGSNDDFNLTGNKVISHPHHATILNNGNLLLFDNGVTKSPKQTRVVEFDIDETSHSAQIFNEYSDTGRYFDIMGSVQKLDNTNYFIGWGGNITSQSNANKSDITEITQTGNIVLDISFSNNPNSFTYSYRALKYNISF